MSKSSIKNTIATLALALALVVPVFAQQTTEPTELPTQPTNSISFVPQYALFRGIRVDYEKRLKDAYKSIIIAPQLYMDIDNDMYNNFSSEYVSYESMIGFGLNLYFKSTTFKSNNVNSKNGLPRHSLYFAMGPNYQYFSLSNSDEVAVPYLENGITYYQFDVQEIKKPIYRFGGVIDFGWQLTFDRFLLDMYLGIAVKYSLGEGGSLLTSRYSPQWVDIDYSGILMDAGLKLGYHF